MKFTSLFVFSVLLASYAHADVGAGKILNCKSSKGSFEIHQTATVGILQGSYSQKSKFSSPTIALASPTIALDCGANRKPQAANIIKLFGCTESRNGDQRFLVNVESGGPTGFTMAYVTLEQMFPLPLIAVDTLICQ